jgi:hypothetical protein
MPVAYSQSIWHTTVSPSPLADYRAVQAPIAVFTRSVSVLYEGARAPGTLTHSADGKSRLSRQLQQVGRECKDDDQKIGHFQSISRAKPHCAPEMGVTS